MPPPPHILFPAKILSATHNFEQDVGSICKVVMKEVLILTDESSVRGDNILSNGDTSGQTASEVPLGGTSEENSQSGAEASSQAGSVGDNVDNVDDKGQGSNVRVELLEKYNKDKTMGKLSLAIPNSMI